MTTVISRDFLKDIRPQIEAALADLAAKNGITLKCGNCSFNPSGSFSFKLEGLAQGGQTREAAQYEQERKYDPTLPALNSTFKWGVNGYTYTVIGSRRTKALVTRGGKTYLVPLISLSGSSAG